MNRETLKLARVLVNYFVREDAEPGQVAKHLFDNLGYGARLRMMDLVLIWLGMHARHYQVTGERSEIGGLAEAMLGALEQKN